MNYFLSTTMCVLSMIIGSCLTIILIEPPTSTGLTFILGLIVACIIFLIGQIIGLVCEKKEEKEELKQVQEAK